MSLINTQILPFKAMAYHNGEFKEYTNDSIAGKWSVFVFYPADFTFVCPTELEDLADNYAEFQKLGVEVFSVSTDTIRPMPLVKLTTQCLLILPISWLVTSKC